MQKKITIYDIAREACVSAATVSRALSNGVSVSPDKRERIMRVVEKYHYRPNALAQGLSKTSSRLIGLLCPDVRNPFYANIFFECERSAYERGYTLIMNNTFSKESLEIAYMQKMIELRVECLIICGGVIDWNPMPAAYRLALEQCSEQVPIVVIGQTDVPRVQCVSIDFEDGMHQAVRHLATLGHRRIAFIHGYGHVIQTQRKLAAFRQIMQTLQLPLQERYIVDAGAFDEHGGFDGMNRLLQMPEIPTAVITTNDMMAVGALQAIAKIGYDVPHDISLIGFDDTFLTELTKPHVTSTHFDYRFLSQEVIDAAVEAISGSTEHGAPRVVPTSLTIRDTVFKMQNMVDK